MLYLHCGWPKTGTTTLQTALARNRARLAAAGTVYPERWTRNEDNAHRLFEGKGGPDAAIAELVDFLEANSGRDVLISSEVLCLRLLLNGESQHVLSELVAAASGVTRVRCIWTLRRFDELVHSVCVHKAKFGRESSPAELEENLHVASLFAGMGAMAEAADETVYVRYSPSGRYEPELTEALGIPGAIDLRGGPRENVGITHKQAAVMLNLGAISERCRLRIDPRSLRESFECGELHFAEDRRCELFDTRTRQELHDRALAAAEEHGISAYARFFADEELVAGSPPLGDSLAVLGDEDLERLAAYLREVSGVAAAPDAASP